MLLRQALGVVIACATLAPGATVAQSASSVEGLRIAYTAAGAGDTAIVFVHGWACNRSHWVHQMRSFASRYRVVALDLVGHGESDRERSEWSMERFGTDIAAVVNVLDLRNVILVGHSAGGFSALEAARLLRGRVVAVIGVDSYRNVGPGYFERRYSPEELANFARPLRANFDSAMTAQVRAQFFLPTSDSGVVARVASDMARTDPVVAIPAMLAFYHYRNGPQLSTLQEVGSHVPIVAINAERSRLDPAIWRTHVRRFDVVVMPAVGHFPMLERPDDFNRALTGVLQSLRR
jgi:pimeloyl-ACP methyl ester carboxylesterase